jgi:hypothetical protein
VPEHALAASAASPTSVWLLEILAEFTAFPAALLLAVCERHGCDVATLGAGDVPRLIHPIALQVALFNDVDAGFIVKRRLLLALSQR